MATRMLFEHCGVNINNLNYNIFTVNQASATSYDFEVNDGSNSGSYNRPRNFLSLLLVPFANYNKTLNVRVRYRVGTTIGPWSEWCVVKINNPVCDATLNDCEKTIDFVNSLLRHSVMGLATQYRYQIIYNSVTTTHIGTSATNFKLSDFGYTQTGVYQVRISGNVAGNWSNWGSSCTVTIDSDIPTNAVLNTYCNTPINNLSTRIYCKEYPNITEYEWNFDGLKIRTPRNSINLEEVSSLNYGVTSTIKVQNWIGSDSSGYGNNCNLIINSTLPITQMSICNNIITNSNTVLYCNRIGKATEYEFEITNTQGYYATTTKTTNNFNPKNLPDFTYGSYNIRVRALIDSANYTDFGNYCSLQYNNPNRYIYLTKEDPFFSEIINNQNLIMTNLIGITASKNDNIPTGIYIIRDLENENNYYEIFLQ